MISDLRILNRFVVPGLLLLVGLVLRASAAAKPELLVAVSPDIPPYVMGRASSGLEIDIARQALRDYSLRFIQLPYAKLQTAVQERWADVSVGVQPDDNDIHYSADVVTFVNYAISKKADGFRIGSVADLRGHQVLTWENAYVELGGEFEKMFSPQSPLRKNYVEVADQREQVRKFWEGKGLVIVIDQSIFNYFSREMGHGMSEADFHAIFPPVTDFKAGFRDVTVRNRFNEGLAAMCGNGDYAQLLRRYGISAKQTVCK